MAEGDIEVELKDDDDQKPIVRSDGKPVPPPADEISADIAATQRTIDAAEARARAAEARATAAESRAAQVETSATGDRLAMVQNALDTIDANIATLQAQMADAMVAGDFAKHSELNVALAKQVAAQPDLLRGKAALEHQAKQPAPKTIDQLNDDEKIELYTKTMQPRAKAWIRAHPQYVLDSKLNTRMLARHYAALDADHVEGSDGYFRFIEDGLAIAPGNGHDTNPVPPAPVSPASDPTAAAAQVVRRRDEAQPPAAAPSRGGGGSRKISLTPREQEAAQIAGLTFEEYGKLMERERKAGTIKRVH